MTIPYSFFCLLTSFTYARHASVVDIPFRLTQASHFAFAWTWTPQGPGPLASPSLICLYRPYKRSFSVLLARPFVGFPSSTILSAKLYFACTSGVTLPASFLGWLMF